MIGTVRTVKEADIADNGVCQANFLNIFIFLIKLFKFFYDHSISYSQPFRAEGCKWIFIFYDNTPGR